MSEYEQLVKVSDAQLIETFKSKIESYKRLLGEEYNISSEYFDDISYLVSIRDMISETYKVLKKRDLPIPNIEELIQCDEILKKSVQSIKPDSEVNLLKHHRKEKTKWWYWLDSLQELSNKDKQTI